MGGGVSYTFTSTRTETLYTNGDISSPTSANLPKVKIIENNNTMFVPLVPGDSSASDSSSSARWTTFASSSSSTPYSAVLSFSSVASVTIDGTTYWGYKNKSYKWARYKESTTSYPSITVSACTIKVVKYVASDNIIGVYTYTMDSTTVNGISPSGSYYPYQTLTLNIPKFANDIILSISIEYPEE